MRNLLILACLALFCQSCFTYKNVDKSKHEFDIGGRYKIKQHDKTMRARLLSETDSTLLVSYRNDTVIVKKADIKELKAGKFSWLKTVLFPVGVVAAAVAVLFVGLAATW